MSRPRTFDEAETARRAMDLFWQQGFGDTPAATISDHLGLGMGSIYQAYGSKEGLYRAALEQYQERGLGFLAEALASGGTVRDSLRAYMIGRVTEALDDPRQRGCLLVNTIGERLPRDSAAADFARGMQRANREAIAGALVAAVERGELRGDTDADALAGYLVTVMNGLMVTVKVAPDRDDLIRTVDLALGVVDAHRA
ncbi:TetR/AcrR family transcriptional regulator [Myceligenerans pegani]|uniref:TetR/AcrR family transcriptional regulator n=1 Tax=Myceligenerans pegani TaxID=2776917 RepID=A0ABR9MZP1_9MICO|nr:TetR/AcrR family transcriptional regulator [Myceligenerans sp. TRM 65318]MBE1876857.1 TetR/AcrR family transcriptional regulator [Myceligenerans sp. TRM 65318]MBE3019128.1 TetR/AcrR family transcriptional regulator [Myceligenerans sp. TRM 65318]